MPSPSDRRPKYSPNTCGGNLTTKPQHENRDSQSAARTLLKALLKESALSNTSRLPDYMGYGSIKKFFQIPSQFWRGNGLRFGWQLVAVNVIDILYK
jgi:hypothetical protein